MAFYLSVSVILVASTLMGGGNTNLNYYNQIWGPEPSSETFTN